MSFERRLVQAPSCNCAKAIAIVVTTGETMHPAPGWLPTPRAKHGRPRLGELARKIAAYRRVRDRSGVRALLPRCVSTKTAERA